MHDNEDKENGKQSKATWLIPMVIGGLLSFVGSVKSGAGASGMEVNMFFIGGFIMIGIGGIIKTLNDK